MKKNAIRTLVAVGTGSLALAAAGPATAGEHGKDYVSWQKQRYVDVLPAGPVDDHGIAWVSGSGGIRG